jgi:hypothetical protein
MQGENVTIHGGIQLGGPDSASTTADFSLKTDDSDARPSKLRLVLNRAREVFRSLIDLASGITVITAAVRSVT